MNQKTFLKVAGSKFENTLGSGYAYTPVAHECMSYVDAWQEIQAAAVYERDGYRFHLVYAHNLTHFKYDGPGSEYRCINLFVEAIVSGECWLESCMSMRSVKDGKATIRRYRDFAINAPVNTIEEGRLREEREYSWRYFKVHGHLILSAKEIEREKTAV